MELSLQAIKECIAKDTGRSWQKDDGITIADEAGTSEPAHLGELRMAITPRAKLEETLTVVWRKYRRQVTRIQDTLRNKGGESGREEHA